MEDFYRWQRRRLDVLMDGSEPLAGRWNFDSENREPPPGEARPPAPYRPREDHIDEQVRSDLDQMGLDTFGEDAPRQWPATRAQARRSLDRFVAQRLPDFGRWQDAMLAGEQLMWHSHISSSLNLGLLNPMECVDLAVAALEDGKAPINAVEGFVRQIVGWREYVWGAYWLRRPVGLRQRPGRERAPARTVLGRRHRHALHGRRRGCAGADGLSHPRSHGPG